MRSKAGSKASLVYRTKRCNEFESKLESRSRRVVSDQNKIITTLKVI